MLSPVFRFFSGKTLQQVIMAVTVSMKAPGMLTLTCTVQLRFVLRRRLGVYVCIYVSVTLSLV